MTSGQVEIVMDKATPARSAAAAKCPRRDGRGPEIPHPTPPSRQVAAAATARSVTENHRHNQRIAGFASPRTRQRGRRRGRGRPPGARARRRSTRSASSAAPTRRRRQPGVEDEGPRGVDEVVADRFGAQHDAALAAQRLGQRRRHHHVRRAGQAEFRQQPAATGAAGFPARAPRRPAAGAPWSGTPFISRNGARAPSVLNTESVTTRARSRRGTPSAASTAATSRCGLTTTRARTAGRHRPGGVRGGVGHHQRAGAGQAGHRAEVGGVARGERQSRCGTYESGQSAPNLVQFPVLPVTSREPVDPAPQVRNARTPASMTSGCRASPR